MTKEVNVLACKDNNLENAVEKFDAFEEVEEIVTAGGKGIIVNCF